MGAATKTTYPILAGFLRLGKAEYIYNRMAYKRGFDVQSYNRSLEQTTIS